MTRILVRFRFLLMICIAGSQLPSAYAGGPGGACCYHLLSCTSQDEESCASFGGTFVGPGSDCAEPACIGACCLDDGSCVEADPAGCATLPDATFRGALTTCETTACTVVCCLPDGTCDAELSQPACTATGGTFDGAGTSCAILSCAGACCLDGRTCVMQNGAACASAGGSFLGPGSSCSSSLCPSVRSSDAFDMILSPGAHELSLAGFDSISGHRRLTSVTLAVEAMVTLEAILTNATQGIPMIDPGMVVRHFVDVELSGGMTLGFDARSQIDCDATVLFPGMSCDFAGTILIPVSGTVTSTDPELLARLDDAEPQRGTLEVGATLSPIPDLPYTFTVPTHRMQGVVGLTYAYEASGCPGDLDASDTVGMADLVSLLGRWGTCLGCPEDLDGDGAVGADDLNVLITGWGPCPARGNGS